MHIRSQSVVCTCIALVLLFFSPLLVAGLGSAQSAIGSAAIHAGSILFHDRFESTDVETATIYPGELTELDGGLLIGAHPHILDEPITIEVEWFDPGTFPDLSTRRGYVRIAERFVQITVTGLDDDYFLISGPSRTGFVVGLPVPENMDENHIIPMMLDYGDFALAGTAGKSTGGHEIEDTWHPIIGVLDPDYDLYLADVPVFGADPYPVRLGLVEHKHQETEKIEPLRDWLEDEYFPWAQSLADHRDLVTWKVGPGGLTIRSTSPKFDVRCELGGDGDPSRCTGFVNPSVPDILDAIEDALYSAQFQNIAGDPVPKLSTNSDDAYIYYLRDEEESSRCWRRGYYWHSTTTAVTCMRAAGSTKGEDYPNLDQVARTTRHELFHAIQLDYGKWRGSIYRTWYLESWASLVEDGDLSITRPERPVDVPVTYSGDRAEYQLEHFLLDLLLREDMADLYNVGLPFSIGLRSDDMYKFVENETSFDSIGEAHWRWVRNAAFEGDVELPGSTSDDKIDQQGASKFDRYTHDCSFNSNSFNTVHELTIDPNVSNTFVLELDELEAAILKFELPPFTDDHHYYQFNWQTLNPSVIAGSNVRLAPKTRIYTEDLVTFSATEDECIGPEEPVKLVVHNENAESAGTETSGTTGRVFNSVVGNYATSEPRIAYLLISNPANRLSTSEYQIAVSQRFPDIDDVFPPKEEFAPSAKDYEVIMTDPEQMKLEFQVLQESDPGFAGGELELVEPEAAFETGAGNLVEVSDSTISLEFADDTFEGFDTFSYRIINRNGFDDHGTIHVTRALSPTAADFSLSVGVSPEPVLIDVLSNAVNPVDTELTILGIDEQATFNGVAEIVSPDDLDEFDHPVIRYTSSLEGLLFGYQDVFEYTISNGTGLTDTGRVTIDVRRRNISFDVDEYEIPFPDEFSVCKIQFASFQHHYLVGQHSGLRSTVEVNRGETVLPSLFRSGFQTVLKDLMSSGTAAAGWSDDSRGRKYPVIWVGQEERLYNLMPAGAPDDTQGRALVITDGGWVAGQLTEVDEEREISVPVVWFGDSVQTLRHLVEESAIIQDANPDGSLIGFTLADNQAGRVSGHLDRSFPPPHPLDAIGPLPPSAGGCDLGIPLDLNGLIHGSSGFLITTDRVGLWDDAVQIPLGHLGVGGSTVPRSINESGLVIGVSLVDDDSGSSYLRDYMRGFIWSPEAGMEALPELGGGYADAYDLNDEGVIVGQSRTADGDYTGVVWQRGLMIDANALLPAGSPWQIHSIVQVDDESTMLAWATHSEGRVVPLRLTPSSVD